MGRFSLLTLLRQKWAKLWQFARCIIHFIAALMQLRLEHFIMINYMFAATANLQT